MKRFESLTIKYPVVEFDFAYHDKHVKKLKEEKARMNAVFVITPMTSWREDESLRLVYEKGTEESCYYCHDLRKKRGPELAAITAGGGQKRAFNAEGFTSAMRQLSSASYQCG